MTMFGSRASSGTPASRHRPRSVGGTGDLQAEILVGLVIVCSVLRPPFVRSCLSFPFLFRHFVVEVDTPMRSYSPNARGSDIGARHAQLGLLLFRKRSRTEPPIDQINAGSDDRGCMSWNTLIDAARPRCSTSLRCVVNSASRRTRIDSRRSRRYRCVTPAGATINIRNDEAHRRTFPARCGASVRSPGGSSSPRSVTEPVAWMTGP